MDIARFYTITPINFPFKLKLGQFDSTNDYHQLQNCLAEIIDPALVVESKSKDYQDIGNDNSQPYLFRWNTEIEGQDIELTVFKNGLGIVKADLNLSVEQASCIKLVDKQLDKQTDALIAKLHPLIELLIQKILEALPEKLLRLIDIDNYQAKSYWTSKMLNITKAELESQFMQQFLPKWLDNTSNPADAQAILSHNKDYSMTWLHYAIVDPQENDDRINAMILSQYFYTALDNCNESLKHSITQACEKQHLNKVQQQITSSRLEARLLDIDYNETIKHLTRNKRRMIIDILQGWDYDKLQLSNEKMIEVCSERLTEAYAGKRERASVMTDILLVGLSFFAVFELSLYLTELSREMVSRPALYYNDESASKLLLLIANIDTDTMILSGLFLTVLFVVLYRFLKFK